MRTCNPIVIVSFVAVCSFQYWISYVQVSTTHTTTHTFQAIDRDAANPVAKADGCYHVFLDVGSNIGNHVRFLYEPHLYPAAKIARKFFEEAFGPESDRVNSDICIFSFEPNPDHYSRHEHLSLAYRNFNWRYTPVHAGVAHNSGNITFYHTGDDLGFTTKKSNCRKECRPEEVPIIRLADWIKREVADRKIPQIGNTSIPPRVVMKMDVEFMEYEILPDLMLSGVLCNNIHAVMGEFHHDVNIIAYLWPMTYQGQGEESVWTLDRGTAKQISTEWLRMMKHNPNCNTKFSMKDDESYRNDGQPLPPIHSSSNNTSLP